VILAKQESLFPRDGTDTLLASRKCLDLRHGPQVLLTIHFEDAWFTARCRPTRVAPARAGFPTPDKQEFIREFEQSRAPHTAGQDRTRTPSFKASTTAPHTTIPTTWGQRPQRPPFRSKISACVTICCTQCRRGMRAWCRSRGLNTRAEACSRDHTRLVWQHTCTSPVTAAFVWVFVV
jgi:hypothetical protein